MKALRRLTVRTTVPPALAPLSELVMNLRWAWHPPTTDLFAELDPRLWDAVNADPVRLLGEISGQRLDQVAADTEFVAKVRAAHDDLRGYLTGPRWYQTLDERRVPGQVAYFSPEFGLTEVLPQYSGGLGILAGDHLKTASDLGVPMIGVGLLYRSGYFAQSLTADGWQEERYPSLDPNGLPLALLREADGQPTYVTVSLPDGQPLRAQVWVAQVGRVPLLLMDADVEVNAPAARAVTDRLYGGGAEHRLNQELLLGIGGVRAIRAYCRRTGARAPEVFHTNEGHAGFLGLERIRELIASDGLSFDEAQLAVRAGTVFTTHTPVPAGIDRFGRGEIERAFGGQDPADELSFAHLPVDRILELGAEADPGVFNMAHMGFRLAQRANGVSVLHGQVSRDMFAGLWPGFEAREVPIGSVTNGVHPRTWVAREILELISAGAKRKGGKRRPAGGAYVAASSSAGAAADAVEADPLAVDGAGWELAAGLPADKLWRTRNLLRGRLVAEIRRRVRLSMLHRGHTEAELGWVDGIFSPDVLTIGFARRVPSYKRLTLMLRDPDRLRAMLTDPERPVQIVIAGKSHPADDGGKQLIQRMVAFADDPAVRHRIAFLPDYDIDMARYLYGGCDVWLNNPLRPLEACGTSGMKAALNGGLNLSVRDGWWDELYDGGNGWAIPTADGVADADRRDDLEAAALYELLDTQVRPRFYDQGADGVPKGWVDMVRHTLATLGPQVISARMLRDYVHALYTPAARAAGRMAVDGYAGARELSSWSSRVRSAWSGLRVAHVDAGGAGDTPALGASLRLRAEIELGSLAPEDVTVQAAHGRVDDGDQLHDVTFTEMTYGGVTGDLHRFEADVPLQRAGAFGYTVRVVPRHELLSSPAEPGLVVFAS